MHLFYLRIKHALPCILGYVGLIIYTNSVSAQIIPSDKEHFNSITAKETVDLKKEILDVAMDQLRAKKKTPYKQALIKKPINPCTRQ